MRDSDIFTTPDKRLMNDNETQGAGAKEADTGWPSAWQGALNAQSARLVANAERYIAEREHAGAEVYPPREQRYRALALTHPETVRAVILGQDPYHRPGQAMGLAFSVPQGVRVPPSLRTIYKELEIDLGIAVPGHGELSKWAEQGVLLLNTSLSVERGAPGSHARLDWPAVTGQVLTWLSENAPAPIAFMLWGKHAQSRQSCIQGTRHLVLRAAHPAPPYSAALFKGCRHFSQANRFLEQRGRGGIDWTIAPARALQKGLEF